MPKVTLEFEVKQTGVDVRTVTNQAEQSLARLEATSKSAGNSISTSMQRGDEAVRDFSRGAKAFGVLMVSELNPALGQSAMMFDTLARTSRLAGSALTGGLVLAAAAGVTALMNYTQRTNESIEFQTRLNDSVRRFDVSGMTSQLKQVGLELEIEEKKAKAFLGGTKLRAIPVTGFEFMAGDLEGDLGTVGEALADSKLKKLREQQAALQKSIEKVSGYSFEQSIIEVSSKISAAQRPQVPVGGPTRAWATDTIDWIQREAANAKRIIEIQTTVAHGQAASEEERIRAGVLGSFRRLEVEEEAKAKIGAVQKAVAEQELQIKKETAQKWLTIEQDQLTKSQTDYQKYSEQIKGLDKQMAEAKYGTADALAKIAQAGMTPAEEFADRERRAQEALAAAMKRSGQEQVDALKAVQTEYVSLAMVAQRSAQAQKEATNPADPYAAQRRLQYWWMPENQQASPMGDLLKLEKQVKEIGEAMGKAQNVMVDAAKENALLSSRTADSLGVVVKNLKESLSPAESLGSSLDRAAAAAKDLATASAAVSKATSGPGGSAGSSAASQGTSSGNGGGGGGSWTYSPASGAGFGGDYGVPGGSWGEPGNYGGWGSGGGGESMPSFDTGGTVPGPVGRPRLAIVHGGEQVIPAGGSGASNRSDLDRPLVLHLYLDGREFTTLQIPHLQDLINRGVFQFPGSRFGR